MGKQRLIRLDLRDLGQALDGLRARGDAWQRPAEYLKSGYASDDPVVCEVGRDAGEAAAIVRRYPKIVSQIQRRVKQQGGWS